MKKCLMILSFMFLAACGDFGEKIYSANMDEPATVEDVIFSPSQHGSGTGVGFSMGGDVSITSHSVDIAAKYAVVFRCRHGKFIIQGEGERYKQLWQRMVKGNEVTVTFREVHRQYKDGRKEFIKYNFVDAK